jgi:tetrahydromethanopterin S-methyltransferase subunit F
MTWLRRIRGALGMGATWAVGWAFAGIAIGVLSRLLPQLPWAAFFRVFDAPLPALAIPGFVAGVLFSLVLSVAARRRSFEDLSISRFATWGAIGGVMVTLFPFALVAVGLASREGSSLGDWQILSVIVGPFVLLSTVSAALTLLVARSARPRARQGEPHLDADTIAVPLGAPHLGGDREQRVTIRATPHGETRRWPAQ